MSFSRKKLVTAGSDSDLDDSASLSALSDSDEEAPFVIDVEDSDSSVSSDTDDPCVVASPVKPTSRRRDRVIVDSDEESDDIGGGPAGLDIASHIKGTSNTTAASRICEHHLMQLTNAGLTGDICRCSLTKDEKAAYDTALTEGLLALHNPDTLSMRKGLALLMDAIVICNDDARLHHQIISASKRLL